MANMLVDDQILNSKLLVVGAGGIGCELLKDLVLFGFQNIFIIDLDTIDVSNLNRQFLFHKEHVGKSKAVVAKESALKMRPDADITACHDSITKLQYGVDFFKQFSAVTNALDNQAARSHVNRMCLAADIPLIESGTAGFLGHVTIHKKGISECYECVPKPPQKTFPGCTIRNTPSEPIHCIVWAKHLFNQLFGEEDADEDVSPDFADAGPGDPKIIAFDKDGNISRTSTRQWAKDNNFDYLKLFNKLFLNDIAYLLRMKHLWKERRAPIPLNWENLPDAVAGSSQQTKPSMKEQEIWSIKHCASIFKESLEALKKRHENLVGNDILIWDKDDKCCIEFVTACSNIRAHCFGIPLKSLFDVKSLAGNIIPAIATTNAIIAGAMVLQLLKVLKGQYKDSRTVVLNKHSATRNSLLNSCELVSPNLKCYVCSEKAVVCVRLNVNTLTVKVLEEKVLKEKLHMLSPDVEVDDGKGTVLISSDPEEMETNIYTRPLADFGLMSTPFLKCDDFVQNFKFVLNVIHAEDIPEGKEYEIISDVANLQPEEEEMDSTPAPEEDEDPEILIAEDDIEELEVDTVSKKRRLSSDEQDDTPERTSRKKSKALTI